MGSCRCGFSLRPNTNSATTAGSTREPDSEAAPERLRHLYLCQGLSTYQIARITGVDRQRVTRALRKAGVAVRPRGAGRGRPHRRASDPANLPLLLDQLYVRERLRSSQIGLLLGIPERRIRERLREFGIQSRTRGSYNREDRSGAPAASLEAMYVQAGMSADQVGVTLGMSRSTVLRSAHDLGLPVRIGGAPLGGAAAREIELIEALYAVRA
jgi:hypothetical protein